jgi:hypothetical protein
MSVIDRLPPQFRNLPAPKAASYYGPSRAAGTQLGPMSPVMNVYALEDRFHGSAVCRTRRHPVGVPKSNCIEVKVSFLVPISPMKGSQIDTIPVV